MKKVFLAVLVFSLLSCHVKSREYKTVFPPMVSHVEFWNGGSKIYEQDNVEIVVQMDEQQTALTSKHLVYEKYIIKELSGRTICIIDSEALSILYW